MLEMGGGGLMHGSGQKGGYISTCIGHLYTAPPPPPTPGANIFFSDGVKTWSRQGRVIIDPARLIEGLLPCLDMEKG